MSMSKTTRLRAICKNEATPGILLIFTAFMAILISNSSLAPTYFAIINAKSPLNVSFAINDILMTIFFLEVGLEIKHQMVIGHLSKPKQLLLPAFAALGGVITPALFFVFFNHTNISALHGWAIPTATDIAFAVGVISLLGKYVPLELKVLLMSIAVIDDLIAILIIAAFYTQDLNFIYLALSLFLIVTLYCANKLKIHSTAIYLTLGALLWFCMLKTGIHPTLSGVITGIAIPMSKREKISPKLQLYIAYLILPIFALANAGVSLQGLTSAQLFQPVSIGIACGLILGKQLGVFGFSILSIKMNIATLANEISWKMLYGMALLCGIGFTMSIFVAHLAYDNTSLAYLAESKIGVIVGSTISAILGYLFLRLSRPHKKFG